MLSFKKKNRVSYSDLIIEFIDPILMGDEDEDELLEKVKAGMTAWNFCVSDKVGLKADAAIKQALKEYMQAAPPWLKEIIDKLVIRKNTLYPQHDQYLFNAELRRKKGEVVLRVESIPATTLQKLGG